MRAGRDRRALVLQIGVALAVVAAMLAAAIWIQRQSAESIASNRRQTILARDRADAVSHVTTGLVNAETGQRGFLLTMNPSYLEPYTAGLAETDMALTRLDRLVPAGDKMRNEVGELRPLADRKRVVLAQTLDLARAGAREAAIALVSSNEGKSLMDQMRARTEALIDRLLSERDAFSAARRADDARIGRLSVATALIGAGLLGGAVVVLLLAHARAGAALGTLTTQQARLRGTLDVLPDGVAVFARDQGLALWNERLFEVTELPRDLGRAGTPWARFAATFPAWPNAGAGEGIAEVAIGKRTLEVWRGRLSDGGQVVAIADATRRTQAEAIARQAQKMEALGQLTGGVAHDFNNLLQIVSANLELIAADSGRDPKTAPRLTAAIAGVERAARLTRHLLAFARRQPLAPEAIDTPRLMHGFEDLLRRALGEAIEIEVVRAGGLWPMRADPQQLESALLNLCINARDAMAEGGQLTVEVTNAALDDVYAAAHADVSPGQYVAIAVTDTGVGMTATELGRAIEPFYTTKPEGRGTGLGLPMVYGFAKQSGGHFKLYSEPGHGTTARLYIPRSADPPNPVPIDTAEPVTGGEEMVLIVEDDPTVRAAAGQAVRGLGYRTMEAENAATALRLIAEGLRPDLVFTDVVMPGKPSAREMVEDACRHLPGLAVVFTSGYTQNSIVHNGRLDPGVLLLTKPWRVADLARKFRLALARAQDARVPDRTRILLVEDELLVRMTTADLLADLGHEVLEAGSGREALAMATASVDLLICDLGLPDTDGMSLAETLRVKHPGLPVIIASGRDARMRDGFVCLGKPYDQAGLKAAVAAAMSPGQAVAAPLA